MQFNRTPGRAAPPSKGQSVVGAAADGNAWMEFRSEAMRDVLTRLGRIAATDATVLLRGETGTGKEILARHLHAISHRRGGPFVAINCGALSEGLVESELFGHEKGAFTGAMRRRRGLLELARGGTLFLDEVAELSPAVQVRLLRVLQEREYLRLGGEELLHCDIRIVAATHRDLEELTRAGRFRQDLYYRLHVVPVRVPPLRYRPEDLPELSEHLLGQIAKQHDRRPPRLRADALARLLCQPWPGNVRQLRNVLERSLLLCGGPEVRAADLDLPEREAAAVPGTSRSPGEQGPRADLSALLKRHAGNIRAAAAEARVHRRTLYRRLSALEIDPDEFRDPT